MDSVWLISADVCDMSVTEEDVKVIFDSQLSSLITKLNAVKLEPTTTTRAASASATTVEAFTFPYYNASKGDSIELYLKRLTARCKQFGIDDVAKIVVDNCLLDDKDMATVERMYAAAKPWVDIQQRVLLNHGIGHFSVASTDVLNRRQDAAVTIVDYAHNLFKDYVNAFSPTDAQKDPVLCALFVNGLRAPKVRRYVNERFVGRTFEELIALAVEGQRLEKVESVNFDAQPAFIGAVSTPPVVDARAIALELAKIMSAPASRPSTPYPRERTPSRERHQARHHSRENSSRQRSLSREDALRLFASDVTPDGRPVCHRCRRADGHLQRECRNPRVGLN